MPWLIAVLVGLLGRALENLLGRIMIALGVGVVTATGVDLALTGLKAQTLALFSGLNPTWVQLLGMAKVDEDDVGCDLNKARDTLGIKTDRIDNNDAVTVTQA